jgi:putative transcriptional regulator
MSKTTTIARMRDDGIIAEVLADGTERPILVVPVQTMTEGGGGRSGRAAFLARRTGEGECRARKRCGVPLGLTQEEFSARCHIPLGTLRD